VSGGSIVNSYAVGGTTVDNGDYAGGLIGLAGNQTISTSYSTGVVQFEGSILYAGGFVGGDGTGNTFSSGYWDLDTSGINDPSQGCGDIENCQGVTGLSDAQLKSGLPAGFDPAIWGQDPSINSGYPYLLANPPPN
jgi:hypothetical protein